MGLIKSLRNKIARDGHKQEDDPFEIIMFTQKILFDEVRGLFSDQDWELIELKGLLIFTCAFNISLFLNLTRIAEDKAKNISYRSADVVTNAFFKAGKLSPSEAEKKDVFLSIYKGIYEQANEYTQSLNEDLKEPEGILLLADTIQTIRKNIFGGNKSEQSLDFEMANLVREHMRQFKDYLNSRGYN